MTCSDDTAPPTKSARPLLASFARRMQGSVMLTRGANMKFEDLTPEQQEQVKACKTPEEMLEVAKSIGYKLSDEEIDAISGGGFWDYDDSNVCPTRY